MTFVFFTVAAALAIAVVLLLVPTLWRGRRGERGGDRAAVNAAVHRDQLAELERDRAAGILSDADFEQARRELQRRVLDEVAPAADAQGSSAGGARRSAIVLAIVLPLAALLTYLALGSPEGLSPEAQRPHTTAPADVEAMVNALAERLKQNPDDLKGWAMLGRSYRVMGRYGESAQAFANAAPLVEKDANLLAEHAEVLAMAQNDLAGEPTELLDKALKLDPDNTYALVLAGTAAYERADYEAAIAHWQRIMPQLPEGSEQAEALRASIEQAREQLQKAGSGKQDR